MKFARFKKNLCLKMNNIKPQQEEDSKSCRKQIVSLP